MFALLLSSASYAVNGPDLVESRRYATVREAIAAGVKIKNASGLEFAVMCQDDGVWREFARVGRGQTAREVIQQRWEA